MHKNINEKKDSNKKEMNENNLNKNIEPEELKNKSEESESVKDTSTDEKDITIAGLEREVTELKDRFLRKAAEFENYKRRTENDQLNIIKYAAESFIIKLLPVIDDMERSLLHIDSAKDKEALKDGIKLVYDKFIKVLADQGVHKIEAVGKPFDVHYHEALMQKKTNDAEPHTVIEELQPGYIYKDRVIRHSKVVVSDSNEESVESDNREESNDKNGNGEK
jgi:molecular chaperone GrpE